MTFEAFLLLFPIVLAVHNWDEYAQFDEFVNVYHLPLPRKVRTRRVIGLAAISLTLVVAVLSAATYRYKSSGLLTISKVSVCGLMLNGLGHCVLSVRRGKMLPGTWSAVTLTLPYSAFALYLLRTRGGDSAGALLRCAGLGAVAALLAIPAFLSLGYFLARMLGAEGDA